MIATFFFFFNDTATTEIYTLSLHDALPICNRSQVTRKAKELWTLTRLRAGDKVVANRGTSEVLAIGTVKDPDRKSTRLNSSHANISYAVFCLKKKKRFLKSTRRQPILRKLQ